MELQVLSRVGQGIADAIIYIVGMTIILDTVGISHIAEYMGHITIALNVGTFAGPLLGGVVFDRGGYDSTWWMMLGFVILDALLRCIMVEKTNRTEPEADFVSPELGLGPMSEHEVAYLPKDLQETSTGCGTKTPELDIRPIDTVSDQILSTSITEEPKRVPDLILLMASMRLNTALYGVCVQSMIFSGFETVLSLYVQEVWHYTSLGAGLIFIPLTIPAFLAPAIGRVIDRTTPRWALVTGFVGLCPVLVLTRYIQHDDIGQKVLMCALLVLIGLGITITLNPLMAEISYIADSQGTSARLKPENKRGYGGAYAQAYAVFAMAWSIGNIAGPLMCGLIKDKAGWDTMCWTLGLLSGISAVPCFIWSGEGLSGWPFNGWTPTTDQGETTSRSTD